MKFIKDYTDKDIENGNTVPQFGVSWDTKSGKRTGNAWSSKSKAESVFKMKKAAGLNPIAREYRIAGYLF